MRNSLLCLNASSPLNHSRLNWYECHNMAILHQPLAYAVNNITLLPTLHVITRCDRRHGDNSYIISIGPTSVVKRTEICVD